MMRRVFALFGLVGLMALGVFACKGDTGADTDNGADDQQPPPPSVTGIWVVIRAAAGTGVNVNNARIQIYSDAEFTNLVAEGAAVGSEVEAQDTVEVQPGTYYVAAWKDVNGDGVLGTGDFFGYYSNDLGQPKAVQLQQNQVFKIEFTVYVYP